jgi:PAS domain S-box-containing protein
MLSTVLDLIPDSVTITDSQGHLRKVNDSMLELFGYDQGELEGKPASSLFQGLSEGTTFMQDFLNGGPEPKSAKGVRKDGVIIDVIMAATKKKRETSCS